MWISRDEYMNYKGVVKIWSIKPRIELLGKFKLLRFCAIPTSRYKIAKIKINKLKKLLGISAKQIKAGKCYRMIATDKRGIKYPRWKLIKEECE